MTLVVDASVALKWVVEEEGSAAAAALAGQHLQAPDLLMVECASALWAKARRGELSAEQAVERLQVLGDAPLILVPQAELLGGALELALHLSHPVYDCLYLALASRLGAALVTADRRLIEAARRDDGLAPLVEPLQSP